jgi:hypothetical protein
MTEDTEGRYLKAGKTRQRIKIPMHDALHDFLLGLPAPDSGKAFLFPSLAGKSTGGASAEINQHYTHHEIATLRDAIEKLPTFRG